jgi:hypothetical protein
MTESLFLRLGLVTILSTLCIGLPGCSSRRNGETTASGSLAFSCARDEYATQASKATLGKGEMTGETQSRTVNPRVVAGVSPFKTTEELQMGRQVTICVMNLHHWIYAQKGDPRLLRLVIGGQILSQPPSAIGPSSQEYVNFILQLDNTASTDWDKWAEIVDASRHSEGYLPISLALSDKNQAFESDVFAKLVAYPSYWYYVLISFVVLIGLLIYLAAETDLLRYTIGQSPTPPLRSPFSLGLVQMSFWFCLVLGAYLFICITTYQVHVPLGSVLGLLGISSTTGLAAIFVDKQKMSSLRDQRNSLLAEQAGLISRIKDLKTALFPPVPAVDSELRDKESRLNQVDALLAQLPPDPPPPISKGFLADILNDGEGVSFHRFQIIIWTLVLGAVFVWSVYRKISMPEFDASLLTLMGISSGTYVGFKFPEKLKT